MIKYLARITMCLTLLGVVTVPLLAAENGVLVLHNGDKIPARIKEVSAQVIKFEAKRGQDAYDYGEEIRISEVRGIETDDGELLTVEHFRELVLKEKVEISKPKRRRPVIKKIPPVRRKPRTISKPRESSSDELNEVVESLLDAGLAPAYLDYLSDSGKRLTQTERKLQALIEDNPAWTDKLDDLRYIDGVAREAFSRTFRYKPESLNDKLELRFDEDAPMNFENLMGQLHDRIGSRVSKDEFAVLVDAFGKGSARAISDILENYSTWKFLQTER